MNKKLNTGQKILYGINIAVIVFVGIVVLFNGCPKNDVTSCLLNNTQLLLALALVLIFLLTILFGKESPTKESQSFINKKWVHLVQLAIVLIVTVYFFNEFIKRPFSIGVLIFGTSFLVIVLIYNLYKLIKA